MLKFNNYIIEKLGVADATSFYIDELADLALRKTIEYHTTYGPKEIKKYSREYFKRYTKSDFNITDQNLWNEFPINEIQLTYVYHKRYDERYMTDDTGKFVPLKVGGACYHFASGNEKNASRIIREGRNKLINLKMELEVYVWKSFDETHYDALLSKLKSTISHELNHAFENFKRKENQANPISLSVTMGTYAENKFNINKYLWRVWEKKFMDYIYMSEPHELNAFSQEVYQGVKDCNFDYEKYKEMYPIVYTRIKYFQNFDSKVFYDKIAKMSKKYYGGKSEETLDKLKQSFIDTFEESLKIFKDKPRYDIKKLKSMSFYDFIKFFEPIFNNSGDRLMRALGKSLSRKDELVTEALAPSQFRDYVLEFKRTRYEKLFQEMKSKYSGDKNAYRIFIPLSKKDNPIENEITSFLNSNGYEVLDYVAGTCKFSSSKNPSKIGQVLTRLEKTHPDSKGLMNKFVSDNSRKSGNLGDLLVCISRHPYDIAGADSDRAWTNCMTLATPNAKRVLDLKSQLEKETNENKIKELKSKIEGYEVEGTNAWKLVKDIKNGSLISYLIKKDDRNINNPISNLNIKPYVNVKNKKDIVLVSDSIMYGQGIPEFKETVDKWLDEVNGIRTEGLYKLKDGIYIDSNSAEIRYIDTPKDESDIIKILSELGIENYIINSDHSIDVNGDVNISDIGITKIPVNFNKIDGSFNVSVNRLTNLENAPNEVTGDFNCSNNYLTSLDGGPSIVGGLYDCSKNRLKNIKNIGQYGTLNTDDNQIKNK